MRASRFPFLVLYMMKTLMYALLSTFRARCAGATTDARAPSVQSTEGSEQAASDAGDRDDAGVVEPAAAAAAAAAAAVVVCAFCQDDEEVMMCPLCSCRQCYGKQDPSLALLCEVKPQCERRPW